MKVEDFPVEMSPVPGAMPVWRGGVDAALWRSVAQQVREKGGRMVALWGSDQTDRGRGFEVHAALAVQSGLVWLTLPVAAEQPEFPDVSDIFPVAGWMQRAVFDLLGARVSGADDNR
jgi:Ni,Fe-hydrogenase III component G